MLVKVWGLILSHDTGGYRFLDSRIVVMNCLGQAFVHQELVAVID